MSAQSTPKLQVQSSGGQHFIELSTLDGPVVHAYLRGKKVQAEPPVPAFTDVDMIQLGRHMDPAAVQKLLDEFR